MILLVTCAAYVVVVTLLAPLVLTKGSWQIWHPRLALGCWHTAICTSGLAVVAALAQLFGMSAGHSANNAVNPAVVTVVAIGAWVALAAFTVAIATLFAHGEKVVRRDVDRRIEVDQGSSATLTKLDHRDGTVLRYLDSPHPAAYSFRAPRPTIVVTSGLERHLSAAEFESVVEHERAHLRHRHHLAILLSLIVSKCLPGYLPAAGLEQATRLLTELIADDCAVRACGLRASEAALLRLSEVTDSAGLTDRAHRMRAKAPTWDLHSRQQTRR